MLGFNRIKGFLRRIGIRDGSTNGTTSTPPAGKTASGAPLSSAGGGSGGAPTEPCSVLAGLPPNAGSQAVLQHIDRFVTAHSIGARTRPAPPTDRDDSADAHAAVPESPSAGTLDVGGSEDGRGTSLGARSTPAEEVASHTGELEGREVSTISASAMSTTAPMDPAMLQMLAGFPEGVPTLTPTGTPVASPKRVSTLAGAYKGLAPPPLTSTCGQRRHSIHGDAWSEGHFYTRFRTRHPSAYSAGSAGTSPTVSRNVSPSNAAPNTNNNNNTVAGEAGGATEPDLLTLLLRERADVMDALDICIQEVPAAAQSSAKVEVGETAEETQTAAAPVTSTTTAPDGAVPTSGPDASKAAGQDGSSSPSRRASTGSSGIAVGLGKKATATTAAAAEGELPVKVFDMYEWRALLLRIVELLIDVDQAVYVERHLRAMGSVAPVMPSISTAAAVSGAASAARVQAPTNITISEQTIEDLLETECAIATWIVLRDVLQQQMDALLAEKQQQQQQQQRQTSSRRPSVYGASGSGADAPTAARSNDGSSRRQSDDTSKTTHNSASRAAALADDEEVRRVRALVPPSSSVLVDWHQVVRDLQLVLGFEDSGAAECVVCASFLHDDNRELMITIIQHPLPRAVFDRVSTHKRRASIKAGLTAATAATATAASTAPSTATAVENTSNAAVAAAPAVATSTTTTATPAAAGTMPPSASSAALSVTPAAAATGITSSTSSISSLDVDLTMDDLVAVSTQLYTNAIVHTWRQYLEERALIAGVVSETRRRCDELATTSSLTTSERSAAASPSLSVVNSRRPSASLNGRQSLVLPVPLFTTQNSAVSAGARAHSSRANSVVSAADTTPMRGSRPSACDASLSLDRTPQQPMLTARPSEVEGTTPLTTKVTTPATTPTPTTREATPLTRAGTSPAAGTAPGAGTCDGCASQIIAPLSRDDPLIFTRVATAFTFSAGDLTDRDREAVFTFLREGIGARLAASHAGTRTRGGGGGGRRGTVFPGAYNRTTAPSSHVVSPHTDPLAPSNIPADLPTTSTTILYDWMVSTVEAAALPAWIAASPYARLHTAIFERVLLLAWASALHKEVELCLRARPPHLDAACEVAQEENAVAAVCHHFRARQLALSSLVRTNLAVGRTHDTLAAARKHFKREKRAWTSNVQTVFTAVGYLESMVQLVQAQSACSAFGGVIETGQFVLQQTVLCSQMLAAVAPKPRQDFVLRYGACHAKLLHARCILLHEVWCAHASFNDVDKTQRYFTEYINSLSWIQKHAREKALFDAYMERGSQLLKRKQHGKALEQFTAAVELAKSCVAENDAALANKARVKAVAAAAAAAVAATVSHSTALTSPDASLSDVGLVPGLILPHVSSEAYPFLPRTNTATRGCAEDINVAQPRDTAQEAEEAAERERTLDLQWHLAESERMMSLSLVAMAENEVNVRARRDELSNAVNSAYASQSSLQKWQSKGGSPKRILTGGPANLIVMGRALLLLNQPRKAAVLLEPLVEDKGAYASVRPPRWMEILDPTSEPLTAEDIALRVYVNSVRITVFGLYVQSLSRFDGERALRAAQHVTTLLEDSDNWVQAMRQLIRNKQYEVHHARISRSTSVLYSSSGAAGWGSSENSPATARVGAGASGGMVATTTTTTGGMQAHVQRTFSDGVPSSQASATVECSPAPADLLVAPAKAASITGEDADDDGDGDGDDDDDACQSSSLRQRLPAPPPQQQSAVPPTTTSLSVGSGPLGGAGAASLSYGHSISSQTSPLGTSTSAVGGFPSSAASPFSPSTATAQGPYAVWLESRSERVTALRALSQASLDILTGYRELSVTYGDAYCFLERWEEALSAYSQAMALCQAEEDLALRSSAGLTNTLGAGAAASSRASSNVVSPTTTSQFASVGEGLDELLLLESEIDGGIMDIETMDPTMARSLREMLVHGTRVDYHANANAVNARLARVHTALGKLSTAMDYHELVLDFAMETNDKLLQYKSLLALARLYTRTHATAKAQETWEHVSALAHEYQDTTVGRETLRNIIAANEASGMFYEVIANADQLNKLSSNVEGAEAMADRRFALEALAHAHLELAQYTECHAALDEREKVQEKAVEWNGRLMSLRAQAFVGQGDIPEAIKVLVRYVNKARMLANWSELGKANAGLAKAYASGDNLFKARRSYMASLRAFALQGPLKEDERDVVMQAARWLVHYFYLSDEEVQVSAAVVYEPDPLRRGPGGGNTTNASMVDEVDETLEGRTTFDHDLHNNSGDLSEMLRADESKRRTMTADDFEDDFGGTFGSGWGDQDGDGDGGFFSGQSFAGADLSAILQGKPENTEFDGSDAAQGSTRATEEPSTSDKHELGVDHRDVDSVSEGGTSTELGGSLDSPAASSGTTSPTRVTTTTTTSAESATMSSTPKPASTTTTTTSGVSRNVLQPAPTSIAHISFCSRPAAAAGGADALDGSHGDHGEGHATTAATGTAGSGSEGRLKEEGSKAATSTARTSIDISSGRGTSITTGAAGATTATSSGSGGSTAGNTTTTTVNGAAGVTVTTLTTAAQRERRTRPSKVVTLHYRAALETMEWTTRLLLNGDRALSYRPSILYSPAEAVDLAMLTHPRSTFVFYFAEYTMDSSSCYDVVVRPACSSLFFRRSAQVTTLRAYQSKTVLEDISASRDAQARAKMATAAFGGESSKASVTSDASTGGAGSLNAGTLADQAAELDRLVSLDTCKRLYDLHEELWSGVAGGLRRIARSLEDAESVVVVPDATLLHVPFNALMANPEMVMPGDTAAPLGEQSTLTVVPSLLHLVQHGVSRSDSCTRRLLLPPLMSAARDRKLVFLPESLQAPRSLVSNKSHDSIAQLENSGSTAGAIAGATHVKVSTTARRASLSASTHPLQPGSETTSPAGGSIKVAGGASGMNVQNTTLAYTSSTPNSTSRRSSGDLDDEPGSPLRERWAVHYGCTRKELIHAFSDTTTRAIMVLCGVKGHSLVTGDGTVDFKELCQPITSSLDAMGEAVAAATAAAQLATTGNARSSNAALLRMVTSSSTSFVNSPQEAALAPAAARPSPPSRAVGTSNSSGSNTSVGAHGLLLSPGPQGAVATAAAPSANLSSTSALPMSSSLSNINMGNTLSSLSNTVSGPGLAGTVTNASTGRPMLPENVCTNLELVVLVCDRSAATSASEPGMAARLCTQLGCARVLRVDILTGQSFSSAHRAFVNSYLTFLEKAQRWNLEGEYAVALRSAIASARTEGVSSTVWGAFTLVGVP